MKILNRIIFITLVLSLTACLDELPETGSDNFCPGSRLDDGTCPYADSAVDIKSWDFTTAENYTYNTNYVEITSGAATLRSVDQLHSGSDFNSGTHVGTYLDSSNNLTLKNKLHDSLNVKNILPNRVSNLVGYWRMDGNWNDESGNNFHGVAVNSPTFDQSSIVGSSSGNFNEANKSYLNLPLSMDSTINRNEGSVSLWVKREVDLTSSVPFFFNIGYDNGDYIRFNHHELGGRLQIVYYGGSWRAYQPTNVNELLPLGAWAHITLTWSKPNDRFRTYHNGIEINSFNTLGTLTGNLNTITIGSAGGIGASIDDVVLWDTELSSSEVSSVYNAQAQNYTELSSSWTPKWDSIVGYWKMDGNWLDSSGKANHGTPVNGAIHSSDARVGSFAGLFNEDVSIDFISIPNSVTLENVQEAAFTIQAWYKPLVLPRGVDTRSSYHCVICKTGWHTGIQYRSDGQFKFDVPSSAPGFQSVLSGTTYIPNKFYHLVGTSGGPGKEIKLFIDGKYIGSTPNVTVREYGTLNWLIGTGANNTLPTAASFPSDGIIDDATIWSAELSHSDIKLIYNRQKQKYAGHYDSPIVDLGTSGSWTNLNIKTTLPFMKELTSTSESSNDYSGMSGSLSDGLVGYWALGEAVENSAPSGADFEDKSGLGNHGTELGGVAFGTVGKVSKAASFDGVDDYITISDDASLDLTSEVTVSAWFKTNGVKGSSYDAGLVHKGSNGGGQEIYGLVLNNEAALFTIRQSDGTYVFNVDYSVKVSDGKWHHVVGVANATDSKTYLYIDGKLQTSSTISYDGSIDVTNHDVYIGHHFSNAKIDGIIDEAAIWGRALTEAEIQQLYRRGANRLKYQVRSCDDASCDTETFQGPDGTAGTYFSELQNNDTIDGSGNPVGAVQTTSPEFYFSDFVSAPTNSRYFQYRVYMESDDENNLCSGLPCMPELTSVELGPTGRYFGGTPTVITNTPITYKKINTITISESGTCSIGYQLSNNGNDFYFWNGSAWVAVTGDSNRNTKTDVTKNIKAYSTKFGAGSLYLKAYLSSDTSQSCSLKDVKVQDHKI